MHPRYEYRLVWERDGWTKKQPKDRIFHSLDALEAHLENLGAGTWRNPRTKKMEELLPVSWRVDKREVAPWTDARMEGATLPPLLRDQGPGEVGVVAPRFLYDVATDPECHAMVVELLEKHGELTTNGLLSALPWAQDRLRRTLDVMLAGGLVVRRDGPRRSHLYSLPPLVTNPVVESS